MYTLPHTAQAALDKSLQLLFGEICILSLERLRSGPCTLSSILGRVYAL